MKSVEIGVRDLRENLRAALERVKRGEELVITERGLPVARVCSVEGATAWERLVEAGVVARPPRARVRARAAARVRSREPVSPLVAEQRR